MSPKKRPVRHLTDEQKSVVAALAGAKAELGIITDADFVRRFILPEMSESLWRHLLKDDYTGRPEKHIEACQRILRKIDDLKAVQRRQEVKAAAFHDLDIFKAVFSAIAMARNRPDCKRLVVYLAQQGGGKSALCDQLVRRMAAKKIIVMPSWRHSYYAACADVCRSYGSVGPWRSTKDVENDMLTELRREPGIIAFDEGNTLGADSLNMIKVILNETRNTVVLAALPGLFDQMMNKSWFESVQVVRRAVAIIDLDERGISADDVRPFLAGIRFNGEARECLAAITDAANLFAAFDMIETIVSYLPERKEVSMNDVSKAVATAEKMWRLHRMKSERNIGENKSSKR